MTRLIRSEVVKLRTTRAPALLALVIALLVIAGTAGRLSRADPRDPDTVAGAAAHVGLSSLFTLVLGILAVAGEYRHRTIGDTYLSTPRRGRVLAAKALVYGVAGAAAGVLAAVVALASTAAWQAARGGSVRLSGGWLWLTLGGGVCWAAAFAVIGVGIGAVARNVVGAVAGALAWLALIEGVVGQLLGDSLARWLPFAAGSAAGRVPDRLRDGLPQAGGIALLAGYAAAALLAARLAADRDVG